MNTLHTYQPSENDLHKGWRLGVSAVWQRLHDRDPVRYSAALYEIELVGNAGPPADLQVRSST